MALIVFCDGVFYVKTDLAHNGGSVLVWTFSIAPLISLTLCSETISDTDEMYMVASTE